VHQSGKDARARAAQRVAQRDRSAVHVGQRVVQPQFPHDCQSLHREGFVDFRQGDVLNCQAGFFEGASGRFDGPQAHHARFNPGGCAADHAGERLDPERAGFFRAHQHQRGGAVVQTGRIARGDAAVGFEGGF